MYQDEKFPFSEFEIAFLKKNPYILTGLIFGEVKMLFLEQNGVKI